MVKPNDIIRQCYVVFVVIVRLSSSKSATDCCCLWCQCLSRCQQHHWWQQLWKSSCNGDRMTTTWLTKATATVDNKGWRLWSREDSWAITLGSTTEKDMTISWWRDDSWWCLKWQIIGNPEMAEMAREGVLSFRWQHLYPQITPILLFLRSHLYTFTYNFVNTMTMPAMFLLWPTVQSAQ